MDTLIFSVNAVAPIILVILLGYFIQRINMVPENFFVYANKLVFNVAIPVYLFYSVYNIENLSDINWHLILFAVIMVIFICLVAAVFFMTVLMSNSVLFSRFCFGSMELRTRRLLVRPVSRSVSRSTIFKYFSCSSGGMVPSRIASI